MFGQRFNLSRFTRFLGDQPDQKLVVGGPQLIYRTGPFPPLEENHSQGKQIYLVLTFMQDIGSQERLNVDLEGRAG